MPLRPLQPPNSLGGQIAPQISNLCDQYVQYILCYHVLGWSNLLYFVNKLRRRRRRRRRRRMIRHWPDCFAVGKNKGIWTVSDEKRWYALWKNLKGKDRSSYDIDNAITPPPVGLWEKMPTPLKGSLWEFICPNSLGAYEIICNLVAYEIFTLLVLGFYAPHWLMVKSAQLYINGRLCWPLPRD